MTVIESLEKALVEGVQQIGQIRIFQNHIGSAFVLCHLDDVELVAIESIHELEIFSDATDAREIGKFCPEGEYRFTKGQMDLKSGWLLKLESIEALRIALETFYPASVSLWKAVEDGEIRIQNLRDKLDRQTGMYRFAKSISDEGAQKLIQKLCGPGNNCVKKILWKLDDETPLVESEASKFDGILGYGTESNTIPLVCQEACNFFVSKCRIAAKREFEAKSEG